jgi:hypothetical protein
MDQRDIEHMLFSPPRDDDRPTRRGHRHEEHTVGDMADDARAYEDTMEWERAVRPRRHPDRAPSRVEVLRAEIARQQAELVALEAVPDPAAWDEGTMVRFVRRLPRLTRGGEDTVIDFTYLAVRADGRWYTTGTWATQVMSSGRFRDLLAEPATVSIDLLQAYDSILDRGTETAGQ